MGKLLPLVLQHICERICKWAHFSLFVDFESVVLGGSTDELFVALCCASIAAPVPKIHLFKVRKYARCNYEKTAHNPFIIVSVNMWMGGWWSGSEWVVEWE